MDLRFSCVAKSYPTPGLSTRCELNPTEFLGKTSLIQITEVFKSVRTEEVTAFSAHSLLSLELRLNYLRFKNRRVLSLTELWYGWSGVDYKVEVFSCTSRELFHFVSHSVNVLSVASAVCLQNSRVHADCPNTARRGPHCVILSGILCPFCPLICSVIRTKERVWREESRSGVHLCGNGVSLVTSLEFDFLQKVL